MSNLYTNAALTLAALVIAMVLFLVWQGVRRPVLAKVGLRNIPRRPAQSVLIIIGLTLSTIIIISALSVGDTLNYSVQRQAVAAFGEVDEILAPPLLSFFISLGATDEGLAGDEAAANEQAQQLQQLTAGGLSSVLAVLEGGLPGITMDRYEQLKNEAAAEPLIDAVAGSILFPTIIRNTITGQGEPLGFVFAVDQDYDEQFGITTVEGEPVTMAVLQPGVGNIFAQATNVFGMAQGLAQQAGINVNISDAVMAVAGLGAVLTGAGDDAQIDLEQLSIRTDTLESWGIDTTPLREQGIEEVSLSALGITTDTLQSLGVTTTTLDSGAILSNTLGLDTGQIVSATNNLLGSFNLNTLGREIDRALEPFGLQLRQGDIYLNRLGAHQLDARVGDVLEIYVGPLPIPVRVKGIVEEAGPVGALLPVVMMRLDEAQKLFFMNGKVNNILISNLGDAMSGVEHTAAVSDRLRVLAMDEDALNEVVSVLRRPEVSSTLASAAGRYRAEMFGGPGEGPPAFLAGFIENIANMGATADRVEALPSELAQPGVSAGLRAALADNSVRSWLLGLDALPAAARSELQSGFSNLNQFDVIDGLNKQTVLTVADVGGAVFSSIFSLFGIFSILAAVMLIFLIFVMLATERRSEMGIARAIGVQRSHLVQMFVTEGMVYDLIAAALGVALGLAVSYAMIGFLGNLVNDVAGGLGGGVGVLQFHFRAAPASIVIGYSLGVLLTFLVVTFASWQVSRLNIVAAIRDLPESTNARRFTTVARVWRWAFGPLLVVAGALLVLADANNVTYWQLGASLALTGVMLLAERFLERTTLRREQIGRLVYSAIGLGLLVIWGLPWNDLLGRSVMDIVRADQGWALLSFALRGPLLILGAIMVIMFNADVFTWIINRVLGGFGALTPVLKTAIAYPLSARFRTGMAMVMFAMIIATVVIMALVIRATQTLVVMDETESAGFEISTSNTLLSFFNPLRDLEAEIPQLVDEYPRLADIAVVGAVGEQDVQARPEGAGGGEQSWQRTNLVGVNAGYLAQAEAVYSFQARAPGYESDAAVWQALRERDDVAIVMPSLMAPEPGEFGDGAPSEFRRLQLTGVSLESGVLPELYLNVRTAPTDDPFSQTTEERPAQRLQVIGVLRESSNRAGGPIQTNLNTLSQISGAPANPETFYIKVQEGADVRAVQQETERAFLGNGINVTILAESFAAGQNITRGILSLFQGFMALGLLVGIAALGVISTRTVVERRQQIGVLRAIGFQSRMVALSLVLEASFIALVGLLIGAGVGILLGDSIVRTFFTALTPETQFAIPWLPIGLILLVAYGFSLLTTIIPAYQAGRIYPAEALRYE
jgi:putative ABC transport system permease protein